MRYTRILFIQLASSCFKESIGILHMAGQLLTAAQVAEFVTASDNDIDEVEGRNTGGLTEKVSKPKIITDYNQHMSGVDKADQFMVYYACGRKSPSGTKEYFGVWLIDDIECICFIQRHSVSQSM